MKVTTEYYKYEPQLIEWKDIEQTLVHVNKILDMFETGNRVEQQIKEGARGDFESYFQCLDSVNEVWYWWLHDLHFANIRNRHLRLLARTETLKLLRKYLHNWYECWCPFVTDIKRKFWGIWLWLNASKISVSALQNTGSFSYQLSYLLNKHSTWHVEITCKSTHYSTVNPQRSNWLNETIGCSSRPGIQLQVAN